MKSLLTFIYLLSFGALFAHYGQNVKIEGSAKITNMESDNGENNLVVRKSDGTLAVRSVSSLPVNNPIDTTKNLASDLELAKHLCDCGTDLPPFLINSLIESGYTEQQLLDAGVPFSNIFDSNPVVDGDGNEYPTIIIGTQTWLRDNLKTTKYNDGTDIPLVTDASTWSITSITEDPAYCWFDNDISYKDDMGAIYNWYAISSTTNGNKNVCPIGWHIPDGLEMITFKNILGGGSATVTGPKIKEPNPAYWAIISGNNSSGFNARGNGKRTTLGTFKDLFDITNWWRTYDSSTSYGGYMFMNGNDMILQTPGNAIKENGFGVRCLKD